MDYMNISEISGVIGGVVLAYVAGYLQAFREQPMLSQPQGVDTVIIVGVGLLALAAAILMHERKMEAAA